MSFGKKPAPLRYCRSKAAHHDVGERQPDGDLALQVETTKGSRRDKEVMRKLDEMFVSETKKNMAEK